VTPKKLFIVKKLNKSGNSDTISLYDENDSFRGEARFESKQNAEAYLKLYKERINKHLNDVGKAKTRGVNTRYLSLTMLQWLKRRENMVIIII
jgi:hypothetical protein